MDSICSRFRLRFRKNDIAILGVCALWLLGLFFGRLAAASADQGSLSVLRTAAYERPLFFAQLIGQLLPLAVTFLLVRLLSHRLIFPVVVLDAFFFGYTAYLCVRAFYSAGWLVYRILLFAKCMSAFVLLLIWLQICVDPRFLTTKRFMLSCGIMFSICLIDYSICSGFLISVLT